MDIVADHIEVSAQGYRRRFYKHYFPVESRCPSRQ
jgi:hypothetical protein